MTITVNESNLTVVLSLNQPNLTDPTYIFEFISQYSKEGIRLDYTVLQTNDRYTQGEITFPTDFGNQHKNGIYYYTFMDINSNEIEKGLIKIATTPGGELGTESFVSNNENRDAVVYYRPNF